MFSKSKQTDEILQPLGRAPEGLSPIRLFAVARRGTRNEADRYTHEQ